MTEKRKRPNRSRPGYNTWLHINRRCLNKGDKNYHRYGGKGITVCERWHRGTLNAFDNFLEDVGEKPSGAFSIDRIDNSGNYEPDNCRWATQLAQQNNRGNNIRIKIGPHERTVTEWARETGIKAATIRYRWHKGTRGVSLLRPPRGSAPRLITVNGITKRICEWAADSGISANAIRLRLINGVAPVIAVTAPSNRRRRLDGRPRNQTRKNCVFLTANDETHHIAEWSRIIGISEGAIRHRIRKGWTDHDAINTPSRKGQKGKK